MREIKFRAWDKEYKRMSEGYPLGSFLKYSDNWFGGRIRFKSDTHTEDAPLSDCEIMQYTGLKDKAGTEIYEGDILLESAPRGNKYKVWREKGGLVINAFADDFNKPIEKINFWSAIADQQTIGFIEDNLSIIGNIYQTPQLISNQSLTK